MVLQMSEQWLSSMGKKSVLQEIIQAEITEDWNDGQKDWLTHDLIYQSAPTSCSRPWNSSMGDADSWKGFCGEMVKIEREEPLQQNLNVVLNNA